MPIFRKFVGFHPLDSADDGNVQVVKLFRRHLHFVGESFLVVLSPCTGPAVQNYTLFPASFQSFPSMNVLEHIVPGVVLPGYYCAGIRNRPPKPRMAVLTKDNGRETQTYERGAHIGNRRRYVTVCVGVCWGCIAVDTGCTGLPGYPQSTLFPLVLLANLRSMTSVDSFSLSAFKWIDY